MRQFWRVRGGASAAAVLLAAVTLLGCGSSGSASSTTMDHTVPSSPVEVTLVPPAPSTTDATGDAGGESGDGEDDPTEAILEAHRGFWDTWLAANDPPDPDHPGLRRYYTGAAYEHAVATIAKHRDEGLAIRIEEGSVRSHVGEVLEIEGETAIVRDCSVDDSVVVRAATGEVVNNEVVTVLWHATLERTDGEWRVSTNSRIEHWDGVRSCDE